MTTVEILKKARALVGNGWTQGKFAVDKRGKLADIYGTIQPPVRFCSEGALLRTCGMADIRFIEARRAVLEAIDRVTLTGWNDTPGRTQAEVLAAFDKAIELAERSNG